MIVSAGWGVAKVSLRENHRFFHRRGQIEVFNILSTELPVADRPAGGN